MQYQDIAALDDIMCRDTYPFVIVERSVMLSAGEDYNTVCFGHVYDAVFFADAA